MSPNNPSVASEETKKPRSRPTSQSSYYRIHEATSSRHPSSSPSSSKRSSAHLHPATTPSPLKMVTTPATSHQGDATYYYYNPEMATRETQAQGYGWMVPTVIEDDDLMFGGKSLSAWYEEERKRLSYPAEEERRGRQRVRQHHSHSHHHSTKSKDSTSSTEQKH